MRRLLASLLVAGWASLAAASPEDALRFFEIAESRYKAGDFLNAIPLYAAAYREEQDPAYLYNLGQCYRRAGDSRNAAEMLSRYLREAPAAPDRAEVEAAILALREFPPVFLLELPDLTPVPPPPPPPVEKPKNWRIPLFGAAGLVTVTGIAAFFLSGPGVPNTALGHQDAFRD